MEMTCLAILAMTAGFLVLNAAAQQECGGMLAGPSGWFASPGYPSQYTNNLTCIWTLQIPAKGLLTLNFRDFHTEPEFDFVYLINSSGWVIASFSGSEVIYDIKIGGSTTQLLHIMFLSDYIITDHGFLAQYSITIRSPGAHGIFRNVSTPTVLCKVNTTCSLFCYLSSDEPVQYNWTKNGHPLTGDDVMIIENVLIVTPRKEDDYGIYVCKATNSAGSVEYEISLEGEANNGYRGSPGVPSVSRNISTPSVACKLETTCTLFCYMSSNESVRYTWTKNGKSVTGNYVTTINNVLIVTPRAEEDYGEYVCTATNSAGSAEYDITLKKEARSSTNFNSAKEDEDLEKPLIYVIIALSIVVCILVIAVFGCYFCKRQRNKCQSEKVQAELRVTTFGNPAYTPPTEAS